MSPRRSGDAAASCRQFSIARWRARATSACRRPGSIHEGGELGYALAHAAGAAFDHPDLLVACVIGDGEAETGPLRGVVEAAGLPQPAPRRGGAADPAPQRLQDRRARPCSGAARRGRRGAPAAARAGTRSSVSGDDPRQVFPALLRRAGRGATPRSGRSRQQARARHGPSDARAAQWPAIVLRTPRAGPARRRRRRAGRRARTARIRFRCRGCRRTRQHLAHARGVDAVVRPGRAVRRRRAARPRARAPWRRGATSGCRPSPYANGGRLRADRPAAGRSSRTRCESTRPGGHAARDHPAAGGAAARPVRRRRPAPDGGGNFRLFCPDETASNRLGAVFEVTDRCCQLPGARTPTTTWDRTAGSWRCSASTCARAGSRGIC